MRGPVFVFSIVLGLVLLPGCLGDSTVPEALNETPSADPQLALIQDIEAQFQGCQNMTYAYEKDLCTLEVLTKIEGAANDTAFCAKFQTPRLGDVCYSMIAMSEGDYSVCDHVSGQRDLCYYLVAVNASDADGCVRIVDTSGRDECFLQVAKSTNNSLLCENVLDSLVTDACYLAIATSTGDSLLCEKMSDDTGSTVISKDECYAKAAGGDLSVCDRIERYDLKGKCYGEAAAASGNLSICDSESVDQGSCYIKAGSDLEDPSVCENIVSGFGADAMREDCYDYTYLNIAVKNGNASLCERINSSSLRQSCNYSASVYGG